MRHTAEEALARMKKNWPKAVSPTGEVCLRVFRLSDLVRARAQRLTSRHGLSLTEIDVLAALRRSPPPHELSPTELYSAVLITSGGLTKVLHGLEHRGLISRVADDTDRRSRRVRLTHAGRALAERTVATVHEVGRGTVLQGALRGRNGAPGGLAPQGAARCGARRLICRSAPRFDPSQSSNIRGLGRRPAPLTHADPTSRPTNAPVATEAIKALIAESRRAVTRRLRMMVGAAVAVGLLMWAESIAIEASLQRAATVMVETLPTSGRSAVADHQALWASQSSA